MARKRRIGWIVAALGLVSCAPAGPPATRATPEPLAPPPATAASRALPAASSAPPAAPAKAPAPAIIGLEIAAVKDGVRPVFVVSAALGLRERVAEIPERFWCMAAVQSPPGESMAEMVGAVPPSVLELALFCDPGAPSPLVVARLQGGALYLPVGGKKVPLPADGVLDPAIAPPPAPPPGCPARPLAVIVEKAPRGRKPPESEPALLVRIPSLSVQVRWGRPERPIQCASQRYTLARQQEVGCTFSDLEQAVLVLREKDGILFFDETRSPVGGESSQFRLGALVLPCGSAVSFADFFLPQPPGNRSQDPECVCQDASDTCERRCLETRTDREATLTGEGKACVQRCEEASVRCAEARCARPSPSGHCGVCGFSHFLVR